MFLNLQDVFVELLSMIKNGYKIIRETGSQPWSNYSDSRGSNTVTPDIEVSCTAKGCNRHNGL